MKGISAHPEFAVDDLPVRDSHAIHRIELHPPQKLTIVQSIIDQILVQIRNNALKPGDRLPSERELIATLEVSRSSVREALQGLVAMSVLESRPGQGTFVTQQATSALWQLRDVQPSALLRKKMRLDLLDTRAVVDEAVAHSVALHATEEALADIAARFTEYEQVVHLQDRARISQVHSEFHTAIARASNNYFLLRVTELLLNEALPSSLRNPEYQNEQENRLHTMLRRDVDNHRAIYEAILARSEDQARAAVRRHVEFTRSLIETAFSEAGD